MQEWNRNRTILLQKQGKDPINIDNYRPITITHSIFGRVYWGIIENIKRPYNILKQAKRICDSQDFITTYIS